MAKKTNWQKYLKSGYYNASGVSALQNLASGYATDSDSLYAQAQAAYEPTYNAQKLALQQQLESSMTGFNNQLSGLNTTYDNQRNTTNSQYDQSLSSALNSLTKRGLGRSSLVSTQGTAIENARNKAINDISAQETDAYEDIYNNMSTAQSQNAASISQLDSDYATQIESRINELKTQNQTALTNLQLQIAQLQQSGYNAYMANKRGSGGGGSYRSGSTSASSTTSSPTSSSDTSSKLSGNSSSGSSSTSTYNSTARYGNQAVTNKPTAVAK